MFKRLLIITVGLVLFTGAVFAQTEPQKPTLPFYWVTGRVTSLETQNPVPNRTVVFLRDVSQMITTRTDPNGYYRINIYELPYYKNVPVTFEANTYYRIAVPRTDGYGTVEAFALSTAEGYMIKDLVIVANGGFLTDKGILLGTVTDINNNAVIGASITAVEQTTLTSYETLSTSGGYSLTLNPGTYNVTCSHVNYGTRQVTNEAIAAGETKVLNFTFGAPISLTINTASPLPGGNKAIPYLTAVQATGGMGTLTWSLVAGSLPAGLTLDRNGVISGTPTTAGLSTFEVRVSDEAQNFDTRSFNLSISEIQAAAGTVPLFISRENDNIVLTWEAKYVSPRIYALKISDPSQEVFVNTYDPAKWKEYGAYPGEFDSSGFAAQRLVHLRQAGTGNAEVYYKGIESYVNPGGTSFAATFESAWIAGKINLSLYGGFNLISVPFAGTLNYVLGANFKEEEQLWLWIDEAGRFGDSTVKFTAGSWPAAADIVPGRGYWLDILGTKGVLSTIETTVGTIYPQLTFQRTLYKGFNLIGNPFPKREGINFGFSVQDDQIWVWNNVAQRFESNTIKYNGSQWTIGGTPVTLKLIPGSGYWYDRIGDGFNWQATL